MDLKKIAALFVDPEGPYFDPSLDIEAWGKTLDARNYQGPYPVVAHPPCERWGRYWSGGPSVKIKRTLGDDDGCFEFALKAVRLWGGVLEHPAFSHAFKHFALGRPPASGGWIVSLDRVGLICHVEQGNYGHPARKATWLYYAGRKPVQELQWGAIREKKARLDEGFHSKEERKQARLAGVPPIKRLSKRECLHTPIAFRDLLISIAKDSR